jgi:hypothetical protein
MTRCTVQLSLILRYLKRLLFIDCLKDGSIIWALAIIYYSIRSHTPEHVNLLVVSVF